MPAWFMSTAHAASTFSPPPVTRIAQHFDALYAFLLIASLISCILVIGGLVYFALKYRRSPEGPKSAYITHNNVLEFTWSFVPFIIFMVAFGWGWYIYVEMRTVPRDSIEINVIAQKWAWSFLYKSGRTTSAELFVPVNTPIKLAMTSKDVLHSFFVPAFRVKQDVIPGRYTMLWFEADQVGDYQIFCTEYCGAGHSTMLAKVHVLPKAEYEKWLETDPYKGLSMAQIGQKLYAGKCQVCHNPTEEKKIGPGFANLLGKTREFEGAPSLVADANYIRESILNPSAKIVKGYPAKVMPTFAGQLNEQELMGIITYIETLKQ